jgi:hypothetical protein
MAKQTVEESLALDILELDRQGFLRSGERVSYQWWLGEHEAGSIGWEVRGKRLFLAYDLRMGSGPDPTTHYDYPVELTYTATSFGGRRVWFLCPSCGRRARLLYLPPGATHFLCRRCHHLTYESRLRRPSAWERDMAQLRAFRTEPENPPAAASRRWPDTYTPFEKIRADIHQSAVLCRIGPLLPEESDPVPEKDLPSTKRPRGRPRKKRPYQRHKPLPVRERTSHDQAYCVKCRDWRGIEDPQPVTFANGRPALQGTCPICAKKLARIITGSQEGPGRADTT